MVSDARMRIHALLNGDDLDCYDGLEICSMAASVWHELEGEDNEPENESDEAVLFKLHTV